MKINHTTRPGWLCVKREKKFDQAIDPAYAFVTFIFICEIITNVAVTKAAIQEDANTKLNAVWYMKLGSVAISTGIKNFKHTKSKNEPTNIFNPPTNIQPGPALKREIHQAFAFRFVLGGKKRRKSTCSPIWADNENSTAEAAPKRRMSKVPSRLPSIPV